MHIRKNSLKMITKDFAEWEYFCKNPKRYIDFESHYLSDKIPPLMQFLRDWANSVITITSTFRVKAYQLFLFLELRSKVKESKHLEGIAIDFIFKSKARYIDLKSDILSRSGLFLTLREMGVSGFGIYNGKRFHLDFRKDASMFQDRHGYYNVWDNSKVTTHKLLISAFIAGTVLFFKTIIKKK